MPETIVRNGVELGRASSEGVGRLFLRPDEVDREVVVKPGVEEVRDDRGEVRGYRIPRDLVVRANTLARQ